MWHPGQSTRRGPAALDVRSRSLNASSMATQSSRSGAPQESHLVLLNAAYEVFRRTARWPKFQWLDKELDQQGLNAEQIGRSLPPRLTWPDLSHAAVNPRPEDEI